MSRRRKGFIVLISGSLIISAYILKWIKLEAIYVNTLLIIATVIAGYSILKNAIQALLFKIIGIEALVSIAVIGALIIGEYFEGAAVTFLFILGSFLEAKTLDKTRNALKSLMDLTPAKAIVYRDNIELEISPDEVSVGETVIVKPGGKIPVDGIIIKGEASINQAAITGESLPVYKKQGDRVFSGTVIETGYLELKAEKVGNDTSFARIIEMVEVAQDSKAKTQKFIEKFARFYTPGIILLSIIVYLITKNIELTLTLLVIACPGALVISTPVSIVAGIGNAARTGILIKGGEHLEKAGLIDIVAFDKTGTLTIGKPKVANIISYDIDKQTLLSIASGIETASEHHIAKAIIEETKKENISIRKAENFTVYSGKGVKGTIGDKNYFAGNLKLFNENNIPITQEILNDINAEELKGQTVIIVGSSSSVHGIISISDIIRNEAYDINDKLKRAGVKRIIMLTGDNKKIAEAVGKELKIDEVYAELLPEDKLNIIKQLQKQGKLAMVGDGINDAPSLAISDLGISMGEMGTDVAIETADVVLLSDNLTKIAYLFSISKATKRNLTQNLIFALVVVFSLLLGVILGQVFMALGMLIHEISVILVILNAIRLNRFREVKK